VVPAEISQFLADQTTEPTDKGGFGLPGKLRKLANDFDKSLLDHVGQFDTLPQPGP
jgi:hypothetical protein